MTVTDRTLPTKPRVAVVGCGYIGSAFGQRMVREGCDVVGTTTRESRVAELAALGIKPAIVRVEDVEALREVVADRDVVVLSISAGGRHRAYGQIYLEGARNLLTAVAGTSVGQIVYTSSTGVYGQEDGGWVDESAETLPATDNGRILVETERALIDGCEALGVTASVLRVAGIYGPGRGPGGRIVIYAGKARDGGNAWVNLAHRDDIVAAIRAVIDRRYGGVLNVSDGQPVARRVLYDRVVAELGLESICWTDGGGLGKKVCNRKLLELSGEPLIVPDAMRSVDLWTHLREGRIR